jgi:hypothetical protein
MLASIVRSASTTWAMVTMTVLVVVVSVAAAMIMVPRRSRAEPP